MKAKVVKYIFVLIMTMLALNLFSQVFDKDEQEYIDKNVKLLMQKLERYSSLSKDGKNISLTYIDSFSYLFSDGKNAIVCNDIDPESQLNSYVSLRTYIDSLKSWYSSGVSVYIKIKQIEKPEWRYGSDDILWINVIISKTTFGFYKNKKIHDEKNKLCVIIEFNKNLKDFNIFTIQNKKPKNHNSGFYSGIILNPLYSQLISSELNNSNLSFNNFSVEKTFNYIAGLELGYYLNENIGFATGIEYFNFKTKISLKNYSSNIDTFDIDADNYLRQISIDDINEEIEYSYLNIPVSLKLRMKHQKISYLFSVGLVVSSLINQSHTINGKANYVGYYSDLGEIKDLPEYGLYSNYDLIIKKLPDFNPLYISYFASFDVLIPLGSPNINVGFGVNLINGLNSLNDPKSGFQLSRDIDDCNSLMDLNNENHINSFGFKVGFYYSFVSKFYRETLK